MNGQDAALIVETIDELIRKRIAHAMGMGKEEMHGFAAPKCEFYDLDCDAAKRTVRYALELIGER